MSKSDRQAWKEYAIILLYLCSTYEGATLSFARSLLLHTDSLWLLSNVKSSDYISCTFPATFKIIKWWLIRTDTEEAITMAKMKRQSERKKKSNEIGWRISRLSNKKSRSLCLLEQFPFSLVSVWCLLENTDLSVRKPSLESSFYHVFLIEPWTGFTSSEYLSPHVIKWE